MHTLNLFISMAATFKPYQEHYWEGEQTRQLSIRSEKFSG